MANETDTNMRNQKDSSTVAIAVILPSLFAIVIFLLIVMRMHRALLLPRLTGEDAASKEERRKKRLAKLESSIQAQHFDEWTAKQKAEHPGSPFATAMLCVICLDEFDDDSQIRGLHCGHVFHQACLDDWFGRWNEYCPLCHRPILQGMRQLKKVERERGEPPPVAFMV